MRIGIDCRSILHPAAGESAGIGHYVHHLVEALLREDVLNEYVLFFDNHDVAQAKHELVRDNPRVHVRVLPFRTMRRVMPFVYRHLVVARVFDRERLDVLHGPANTVPFFYKRPWVVTVHDLAIYDHPEWFPGGQQFATQVVVPHSIQHARRVIAVSLTTARDVKRLFNVPLKRIAVIPEGVAMGARTLSETPFGLQRGRYFLFLGTIEPRKNIAAAVRAFIAADLGADAVFAIAGGPGWKNAEVFTAIREANAALGKERVRYLGYVSHAEKIALMSDALAFVYPSLYEGFGLPVLEAMALGTPVIASNTPALEETAGDAAVLVSPTDETALALVMKSLWESDERRADLRAAGLKRAATFTWAATAKATLKAYAAANKTEVSTDGHDA